MDTEVKTPVPVESVEKKAIQPMLIYGETLDEVPQDLYIPPEALQLYLNSFEGPLDLLLYLIRKAKFNILDIPMAGLTRQYLEYVETMRKRNLNLAAEYLAMASILIDIKCKMLLPKPTLDILSEGEEDGEDPRAALVRRLLQYEQIQNAALRLNELPVAGRDFFWGVAEANFSKSIYQPEIAVRDLVLIWQNLFTRIKVRKRHEIAAEPLNLREQLTFILKRLQGEKGRYVNFFDVVTEPTISYYVIGFIAVLELSRQKLVELNQSDINQNEISKSPLYVKLSDDQSGIYPETDLSEIE